MDTSKKSTNPHQTPPSTHDAKARAMQLSKEVDAKRGIPYKGTHHMGGYRSQQDFLDDNFGPEPQWYPGEPGYDEAMATPPYTNDFKDTHEPLEQEYTDIS